MDQDKNLNDLNTSKVAEKASTKLVLGEKKMLNTLEESVNLQSNNTKQLPDKKIFKSPQAQSERLPHTFNAQSAIHENRRKSVSPKAGGSKSSSYRYQNPVYDQYLAKNNESLNINTDKTVNSPIKDSNSNPGIFSPRGSTSDNEPFFFGMPNRETKNFRFAWKPEYENKTLLEKQIDADESLAKILICIKSLNTIISNAEKSKVIGIFDSSENNNRNVIKSALLQLRLAPDRVSWINKCVFVNNNIPVSDFSIKEYITNGIKYDAQRYHSAIALSCLREDLKLLASDDLVANKKLIQLTDAQKEKLALARAYYANKDIYFLDDILKSIDETTGECIFDGLIQGALEEKVVIFITCNPVYLSRCNEVYVMKNGEIQIQGDHRSLLQTNEHYASMVKTFIDTVNNKNVKISMKDESNSNERSKAEERTLWFNLAIMVIFFTIVLTLLYTFQHVTMEQFCNFIASIGMKIMQFFDAE